MAVNLSPVGGVAAQFFTNTGAVLTGGKLYTYAAGTTTPAVAYTSSQGVTAWTNPIVLDAAGRVSGSGEIWLTDGINYKFVLKDSNDVLIATYDNISGINSNFVAYTNSQEIITATSGQTVFNLSIDYQPGTNSLSVFVDGVNQYGPGAQYAYVETDSNTVTFTSGLHVGAEVKFTSTQQQGAGAVDASQVSYDPPFTDSVATNVEAKLAQYLSVKDFGAVGNGVAVDTAAINAAMAAAATAGKDLYFPSGVYLIDATLTIPVSSTYARFAIRGEYATDISNTASLPGAVIRTSGNFTAIQTPVLTAPNNTLAYWTKCLEISDIYVSGPQTVASAYSTSVGFNLSGVQLLKAHNLHAEGFGTGLNITDGSEIYLSGRHVYQNNYYGAFLKRSSTSTTDLQAWAENLVCTNNYIPLVLRTVRSFWCNNGELITYGASPPLTGRTPMSRIYIEASYNTQIHFNNLTMENDEQITCVSVDGSGLGILSFNQCNFESAKFPLVTCEGFFDNITVTNCLFGPSPQTASTNQQPIVYLNIADTSDSDARANEVVMSGNSPSWTSFAIYDNSVNRSPYGDRVPPYMQQLNWRREMDQAADNRITVYGNYNFTTSNVLVGNARLYWDDNVVANNFALLTPSRPIKGASVLWVTVIADTNANATVPTIYEIGGIGTSPTDWQLIFSCPLAQFTVGSKTFYKWGYAIEILNATTSASTGVTSIGLSNIYSTSGGTGSGLEYFAVYSDQRDVGFVQETPRYMAAAPSTGLEGYGAVRDQILKTTPSAGNVGFVCTVAGIPGTWVTFG